MNWYVYIGIWVVCYFIGSFSPAVFLSKRFAGYDVREKGSKNAGSTNVFRVMGPKFGIINFILDMLKGFLPTFLAMKIFNSTEAISEFAGIAAGAGVVIGHAFPIFSHFKGGKCVASSTGLLIAFNPITTVLILAAGITSIVITRYVSTASITIFVIYPIAAWFVPGYSLAFKIFLSCVGALIIFLHRKNIGRLFRGEENPLFTRKSKEEKNQEAK